MESGRRVVAENGRSAIAQRSGHCDGPASVQGLRAVVGALGLVGAGIGARRQSHQLSATNGCSQCVVVDAQRQRGPAMDEPVSVCGEGMHGALTRQSAARFPPSAGGHTGQHKTVRRSTPAARSRLPRSDCDPHRPTAACVTLALAVHLESSSRRRDFGRGRVAETTSRGSTTPHTGPSQRCGSGHIWAADPTFLTANDPILSSNVVRVTRW